MVVEYVDANLCIAEAREEASGRRVSMSWNTVGIDLRALKIGSRLEVEVTAFGHAVRGELAEGDADDVTKGKPESTPADEDSEGAFQARATASLEQYKRTGVSFSTEEVMAKLQEKIEKRRRQFQEQEGTRPVPPRSVDKDET